MYLRCGAHVTPQKHDAIRRRLSNAARRQTNHRNTAEQTHHNGMWPSAKMRSTPQSLHATRGGKKGGRTTTPPEQDADRCRQNGSAARTTRVTHPNDGERHRTCHAAPTHHAIATGLVGILQHMNEAYKNGDEASNNGGTACQLRCTLVQTARTFDLRGHIGPTDMYSHNSTSAPAHAG